MSDSGKSFPSSPPSPTIPCMCGCRFKDQSGLGIPSCPECGREYLVTIDGKIIAKPDSHRPKF